MRLKASPVEHEKEICCGVAVAGCASSDWRQTPSAPVGAVYFWPWKVVVTDVPGGAKPKTMAGCGPRCSTIESPKTLESAHGTAADAPAASAAAASARSILVNRLEGEDGTARRAVWREGRRKDRREASVR